MNLDTSSERARPRPACEWTVILKSGLRPRVLSRPCSISVSRLCLYVSALFFEINLLPRLLSLLRFSCRILVLFVLRSAAGKRFHRKLLPLPGSSWCFSVMWWRWSQQTHYFNTNVHKNVDFILIRPLKLLPLSFKHGGSFNRTSSCTFLSWQIINLLCF